MILCTNVQDLRVDSVNKKNGTSLYVQLCLTILQCLLSTYRTQILVLTMGKILHLGREHRSLLQNNSYLAYDVAGLSVAPELYGWWRMCCKATGRCVPSPAYRAV